MNIPDSVWAAYQQARLLVPNCPLPNQAVRCDSSDQHDNSAFASTHGWGMPSVSYYQAMVAYYANPAAYPHGPVYNLDPILNGLTETGFLGADIKPQLAASDIGNYYDHSVLNPYYNYYNPHSMGGNWGSFDQPSPFLSGVSPFLPGVTPTPVVATQPQGPGDPNSLPTQSDPSNCQP